MMVHSYSSCPHEADRIRNHLRARLHGVALQVPGGEEGITVRVITWKAYFEPILSLKNLLSIENICFNKNV